LIADRAAVKAGHNQSSAMGGFPATWFLSSGNKPVDITGDTPDRVIRSGEVTDQVALRPP
jgi:hypothetical protein